MDDSLLEEGCTSSLSCHQQRATFSSIKTLCKRFRAFFPIPPAKENSINPDTPTSDWEQKEKIKKKKRKRKGFVRLGFRTRHLLWPIRAILQRRKKVSIGCGHIRWKKLEHSPPATPHHASKIPKGHIPVEVGSQHQRFVVPLIYLNNPLFQQLLMEAHGAFGFEQDGALALPCSPAQFQHTAWLIKQIT